MYWRLFNYSL